MKETTLFNIHKQLGAKIVPYAGFLMPLEYSGITNEHLAVRNNVGIFDVSHMGEIWVKGANALNFVQFVTTNDASKLTDGAVQYSCFPNGSGGIVDDLLVYRFNEEKYLLVVNAANTTKDWEWLITQNSFDAKLENASDTFSQFAIQGAKAIKVLQKITDVNLAEIKHFTFQTIKLANIDNIIISATGYTGAGGFELYFKNEAAPKLWNAILKAGEKENIQPIGLGARDTLRLEMGYCLYGNDIDDTTSPIEAGLGWIVKFNENKQFIDKEFLLNQKNNGIQLKLSAILMIDKGIPRKGYEVLNSDDKTIGKITSGSISPVLKKGIALAYLNYEYSKKDTEIFIKIRNKKLRAKIIKLPFI